MILSVDPGSAVPVYEQVRAQLATMINGGTLAAGTALPTIRQLANDLGIAKGTVSKVYEALIRDGLIVSDGRRGTSVAASRSLLSEAQRRARLHDAAQQYAIVVTQLAVSGAGAVRALEQQLIQLAQDAS